MEVAIAVTPTRSDAIEGLEESVGSELPDDVAVIEVTTRMFAFSPPELRVTIDVSEAEEQTVRNRIEAADEVESVSVE